MVLALSLWGLLGLAWPAAAEPPVADPAAWGSDHVGQPFPDYVTGDECLFCHRSTGAKWPENRHQLTIRPAAADEPALQALGKLAAGRDAAAATEFLLGGRQVTRFLRRSTRYGQLELLSTAFRSSPAEQPAGQLSVTASPDWDAAAFGDRCAGCHATAVDPATRAFSALSLDCFVCHGDVPLAHTNDKRQALLSGLNREPREVIAICGQCHLRGGKSRSSGLPYPNTFVAGDNLFRDFAVDFSDKALAALPPLEQHIFANARDVVQFERTTLTCLSCHEVHAQTSSRHRRLEPAELCWSCHVRESGFRELRRALQPEHRLRPQSRTCDY